MKNIKNIKNNRLDENEIKKAFMNFVFEFIDLEMVTLKEYSNFFKYKLSNVNLRMCIWVFFQRLNLLLEDDYDLNMEDENDSLDEYFTLKKLNLKSKKYLFNY